MSITTYSSRAFNQDTSGAKKAAEKGPVIITDRGRPAHVLLTFEHYKRVTSSRAKIADLLSLPEVSDVDIEIPRLGDLASSADLA